MNKKLTVVLLEIEGGLAKMTSALAAIDINLLDINAEEVDNVGVARLEIAADDFAAAFEALRDAGLQVMPQEVVLVKLDDKAGSLAKLAVKLADAKVNVRSMRIVKREEGYCLAAIVPEPADIARAVLADKLVIS